MNRIPEDEMDEIESRAWSQPVVPRLLSALREAYQEIDRVRGLVTEADARWLELLASLSDRAAEHPDFYFEGLMPVPDSARLSGLASRIRQVRGEE